MRIVDSREHHRAIKNTHIIGWMMGSPCGKNGTQDGGDEKEELIRPLTPRYM